MGSEKVNSRIKALKRQLDETEEEVSREKAARRKTQRELEDLIAENESKEREITNLKNKLRDYEDELNYTFLLMNKAERRGLGGLPTRLIKGRAGSVQSGSAGADDGSLQDESSLDGEENEKQ